MNTLKGDEMFRLQKHLYKTCGGMLGVTNKQKTIIAIALDAAFMLGVISETKNEEELSGLVFNKMKRLGIDLKETIWK